MNRRNFMASLTAAIAGVFTGRAFAKDPEKQVRAIVLSPEASDTYLRVRWEEAGDEFTRIFPVRRPETVDIEIANATSIIELGVVTSIGELVTNDLQAPLFMAPGDVIRADIKESKDIFQIEPSSHGEGTS